MAKDIELHEFTRAARRKSTDVFTSISLSKADTQLMYPSVSITNTSSSFLAEASEPLNSVFFSRL